MCVYVSPIKVREQRVTGRPLSEAPTWRCDRDVQLLDDLSFCVPVVLM